MFPFALVVLFLTQIFHSHLLSKTIEGTWHDLDTKKAIFKVRRAGTNLPTPHCSEFPPMVAKYRFSNHTCKISERISYPKFHNFVLHDRLNIPNGSRDTGVPNWQFVLLHHYIPQIQELQTRISLKPLEIWNRSRWAKLFNWNLG